VSIENIVNVNNILQSFPCFKSIDVANKKKLMSKRLNHLKLLVITCFYSSVILGYPVYISLIYFNVALATSCKKIETVISERVSVRFASPTTNSVSDITDSVINDEQGRLWKEVVVHCF
jgi:uncharacterized cysteine cluster protein YcgN (CxxCxxCC family)